MSRTPFSTEFYSRELLWCDWVGAVLERKSKRPKEYV